VLKTQICVTRPQCVKSRCELLSETADSDKNPVSRGKDEDLFNFQAENLT